MKKPMWTEEISNSTNESGASLVEYALTIALISLVALAAVPKLTHEIKDNLNTAADKMAATNSPGACTAGEPGC